MPRECRWSNERTDTNARRHHDCAKAAFLRGGVWSASFRSDDSSRSTLRLIPTIFEGDDDGDLEGDLGILTGGVEREEMISGVAPRLPVPTSFLSRVAKLLADTAASA